MRQFIDIIESVLTEGGNVFKNPDKTPATQRVNKEDVPDTIKFVEKILGHKFEKDTWLGSTGKAPTSGDIDLAIDVKDMSKADVVAKLQNWVESNKLDPKDWIKVAAEIHFKTPIKGNPKNGFVQTDFNVYDTDKYDWSLWYNTSDATSQYKGRHRAVLLSSIAKVLNLKLGGNGIFDRNTNELVTTDPDKAAELLLGKGHDRKDLSSVETIVKNLKSDPNKDAKLKDFADFIAKEKLPGLETIKEEEQKKLTKPELEQTLKANGYEQLKPEGNKIKVLVQIPDGKKKDEFRADNLKQILQLLQQKLPQYKPTYSDDPRYGSLGGIIFADSPYSIVVKDSGKQGDKSAGVANEIELGSIIQSVIDKYGNANVSFIDPRGKKLTINDATEVEIAGRQATGRRKADVVIKSAESRLPVSIKKVNADMWESADNLFGQRAKEVVEKLVKDGVVELRKIKERGGQPVYQLSKEIVMEPTEEEALQAIFGADINPEGGIVIQTFKPEHFKQDGNNVNVDAHAVITNKDDIPESHIMYWILRNDETRNSKSLGIPGIRPLGVTAKRAFGARGDKNIIFVDNEGNVVGPSDKSKSQDTEVGTPIHMAPKVQGVGREKRK